MNEPEDEIEMIIENAVAELYRGFWRLRQTGQYQREYDDMGVIISMLSRDRAYLRTSYEIEI